MLGKLYGAVGRRMPGAKAGALNAAKAAMQATPIAKSGTPRKLAGQAAMKAHYRSVGRKPTIIGMAAGTIGVSTAMRPNADQSRTSYRGPMQTGRGVGRYA